MGTVLFSCVSLIIICSILGSKLMLHHKLVRIGIVVTVLKLIAVTAVLFSWADLSLVYQLVLFFDSGFKVDVTS